MRVRLGWSGETQTNIWQKADVELDSTDLFRMLIDRDFAEDAASKLSTSVAHKLLSNEAEFLLLGRLKDLGYPEDKAAARQSMLHGQNEAILGALKKAMA